MITDAIITPGYPEGHPLANLPLYNVSIFVQGKEIEISKQGVLQFKFWENIEKALLKNQAENPREAI
jgi:hypothetical protein